MAIEMPNIFKKKTTKESNPNSIFEELGIDDNSLLKSNDNSSNFLSDITGKKLIDVVDNFTHHKTFAIVGYVLIGIFLVVHIGGFFVLQSSINTHKEILGEKQQSVDEMNTRISELEQKIGETQKKLDKKEVAQTLINQRIETEQIFTELDEMISMLKKENIFINIQYYDIQNNNLSTIEGFASKYNDVAAFIQLLENNPHFTSISFEGIQRSKNNEDNLLPVRVAFIFEETSSNEIETNESTDESSDTTSTT